MVCVSVCILCVRVTFFFLSALACLSSLTKLHSGSKELTRARECPQNTKPPMALTHQEVLVRLALIWIVRPPHTEHMANVYLHRPLN